MTRREMLCGLLKSAIVAPLALLGIKPAAANDKAIRVASAATLKPAAPMYQEHCKKCDHTFDYISCGPFQKGYVGDTRSILRHCLECCGTPGRLLNA